MFDEESLVLGQVAVHLKLLTTDQLLDCLQEQRERRKRGESLPLGEILMARKLVDRNGLDMILKEQARKLDGMPGLARYDIEDIIGEGAAAVVYRGRDRTLNRLVAIKMMRDPPGANKTARARFLREARIVGSLTHPNVVSIHDVGEEGGRMYLVLELVEGTPLSDVIRQKGIGLERKVEILQKASRGVAAAHGRAIIHRDLKPENILVTAGGEPKVADFGLAHLEGNATALTRAGTAIGTPLFMAPEQVRGKEVTPRTDVYALGAILYEILTGRTPHSGDTLTEVYRKILEEDPPWPRHINPRTPAGLEAIALKAMAKDPRDRYPTAMEFAEDLQRFLDGRGVQARPPSNTGAIVRRLRRGRPLIIGGAIAVAAVTTLIAVWVQGSNVRTAVSDEREKSQVRESGMKRLAALWTTILERKRELRQLKIKPARARQELDAAVRAVGRYLEERPDEAQGYYVRARGRMYLGDLEGARQDLDIALARKKEFRSAWSLLGMLKIEEYERKYFFGRGTADRRKSLEPGLDAAIAAFDRSAVPAGGRDELEALGLTSTREDQVVERLARALRLKYKDNKIEQARRVLTDGLAEFQAEEYASWLGLWSDDESNETWQTKALDWAPGYDRACFIRGTIRLHADDYVRAMADFDRAIEINPGVPFTYTNRGSAKHHTGDTQGALEDFNKAIVMDKNSIEALLNRGDVKVTLKDFPGGRADFDRVLEIDPRESLVLVHRGNLKVILKDLPGAAADYDLAIEIGGTKEHAYQARAILRERQGLHAEALADYGQAILANPRCLEAHVNRGNILRSRKDNAGALADFDKAVRIHDAKPHRDGHIAYMNRGLCRSEAGDPAGALADYNKAILIKPDYAKAFVNRGVLKREQEDFAGAQADFDRAIVLVPGTWEAHANRGGLKEMLRDYPGALEDFQRALDLNRECTELHLSLAAVHEKQGNEWIAAGRSRDGMVELEKAVACIQEALRSAPKNWNQRPNAEQWSAQLRKKISPRAE